MRYCTTLISKEDEFAVFRTIIVPPPLFTLLKSPILVKPVVNGTLALSHRYYHLAL